MKILLFGGSGMLGHALQTVLTDFDVVTPTHAEVDITNREEVIAYVDTIAPDIIINAAAYTAVDKAESEEALATRINGEAPGNLAESAKNIGALLIHYSTDYIFDGSNPSGYTEDAIERAPLNAYGRGKLIGEERILQSGCRYCVIRTSWLFGPHGKNFVDTMLRLGTEKSELNIVADQIGCPTYTLDLAEATHTLIQSGETGIFHLTNSEPVTWADFATEIFRLSGLSTQVHKIPTSAYPTPAKRPACSILLNTRRPQLRSWKEGLRDYLKGIGYRV